LISNETDILWNDTTLVENSTEILSNIEKPESLDDDVIELDVSGQKITTLRSTLTAVPNSKLAMMFTKDNTSLQQLRDKQGTVFFDYNPVQFNYLLDQLRMIKRTPEIPAYELDIRAPGADTRMNFSYMISDLGLNRK
jgi:Cu/Ag efflux protein CusF